MIFVVSSALCIVWCLLSVVRFLFFLLFDVDRCGLRVACSSFVCSVLSVACMLLFWWLIPVVFYCCLRFVV